MANRYKKILKTLKEAPTNRTGGLYQLGPVGQRLVPPDKGKTWFPDADGNFPDSIPGGVDGEPYYFREPAVQNGERDWEYTFIPDPTQDYLVEDPTGKNTDGLIDPETGIVKTFLPPNSRNFILGPLVDAFVPDHGYDAITNIGYIQKDTRQFVLLARVDGQFVDNLHGGNAYRTWDGQESSFTAYNSNFTYDMALWFRDQINSGDYITNVPYFQSGGVPQPPIPPSVCPLCPPDMYGGVGPGNNGGNGGSSGGPPPPFGFGGGDPPPQEGEPQGPPDERNPEEAGAPFPGANPNRKRKRGQGGRPGGSSGNRGGYGDDNGPEKEPNNPFRNDDRSRWPPDYAGDEKPRRGQGNRDTRNNPNRNRETPKADPRPTPRPPTPPGQRPPRGQNPAPRPGPRPETPRPNPTPRPPTPPGQRPPRGANPAPRPGPRPTPSPRSTPTPTPRGQGNQSTTGNPNRQRQTPSNQSAISGVRDGLKVLDGVKDAINKSRDQQLPPTQGSERPQLPPGTLGTKENPVTFDNLSDNTLKDFAAGISPSDPPDLLKMKIQNNILNRFNPGTKGTINNFNPESQPFFDANGDLNIPDTYAFDPGGDIGDKPFLGTTVGEFAKAMSLGSEEMEKDILTFFDKAGVATAPGRKDPMMHINIKVPSRFFKEDYKPKFIGNRQRQTITEARFSSRQIQLLREIKQPVKVQEPPKKYKIDFSHKYQTPDTRSTQTDGIVAQANERGNRWRSQDKNWTSYESQERMNIVHDRGGHGKMYMDLVEKGHAERSQWMTREIQEQLNEVQAKMAERKLYGESTTTEHEKNFDKVTKLKKVVSEKRPKDIAPEYPVEPPPEMVNGVSSKLHGGEFQSSMYNSLDPESAESMPKTAYPEIDKKVKKAKKKS